MAEILGEVIGKVYVNKHGLDEEGNPTLTRVQVPIQKNLRFDRNTISELDTCNFQYYSDEPSDISIMDIIEIYIYNVSDTGVETLLDSYSYVVIQVDSENTDKDRTNWNNFVAGTECTKRLEGYTLTRDFSQPLPNELDTPNDELPSNAENSPYDGYPNRLKMIDEAKRFCYFRKEEDIALIDIRPWDYIEGDPNLDPKYSNGEDNSKTTYARLAEDLGTENIAAVTASNDTLRDIVDKIFSALGATARLDYVDSRFVLKADDQNEITGEVDITRHAKTKIQKTINGFGTCVNPELQNVVGQDSLAINGIAGRPLISETVFTQTDTAKIVLDYPIKDIVKVEFAQFDSNTFVDVTKYIIKDDQRRFLDQKEEEIVRGDDLHKNNVGSYAEGGNEITGFGDEFEGETMLFFGAAITTVWQAIRVSVGATGTLSSDIREHRVRVEYRTITSEKVEIFKNDFSEQKVLFSSAINESDQTIDFKRAGISLQDKVEKTGSQTNEIDIVLDDEIIQKGINYYDIKEVDIDTGKVIVKVDNTIINGNLKTKYTLAKGGYLNAQVNVDSLKRASAIESGLVRELIIKDFVNIGFDFVENGTTSSVTAEGMQKFMDTFRTINSVSANVNGALLVSNDLLNVVSVGVIKHVTKDFAKVGFRANNPVHLGYKQVNGNKRSAVRYAQRNGTTESIGLAYGLSESLTDNEDYNKILPEIDFTGSIGNPISGTKLIDMGDTSATDGGFGDQEEDSKTTSDSASGTITAPGNSIRLTASINSTLTFDKRDGFTLIPREVSGGFGVSFGQDVQISAISSSYRYEVYIDGVLELSAQPNSSFSIDLRAYTRVDSVRVVLVGSYAATFQSQANFNEQVSLSIRGELDVYEEEILPPTEGERNTVLTVLKTPNEVLGIMHGLNAIKNTRIITGQNLFTKNSLYTENNYDSFVVYESATEFYSDGDEIPKGTINTNQSFTITEAEGRATILFNLKDTSLKSYAIFGVNGDKNELLFAVNSEFGKTLEEKDFTIVFQFSSKARGLIME